MPCCKPQRNQVAKHTHVMLQNKYNHFVFANWHAMLQTTKEPGCNHTHAMLQTNTTIIFCKLTNAIRHNFFFSSRCKCIMLQSNTTSGCKQTQVYSLVAIRHIFYFLFRRKQHTRHVANHKGTRLQSHTCHVANKHKPLCLQTDRCN
jgi:hypothetical protein